MDKRGKEEDIIVSEDVRKVVNEKLGDDIDDI